MGTVVGDVRGGWEVPKSGQYSSASARRFWHPDVANVQLRPTMFDQSIYLKPDDSTFPADTESWEDQEKLKRLADEIGSAGRKNAAKSQPRSRYSYDVVEM
jgi:hypothetical protein